MPGSPINTLPGRYVVATPTYMGSGAMSTTNSGGWSATTPPGSARVITPTPAAVALPVSMIHSPRVEARGVGLDATRRPPSCRPAAGTPVAMAQYAASMPASSVQSVVYHSAPANYGVPRSETATPVPLTMSTGTSVVVTPREVGSGSLQQPPKIHQVQPQVVQRQVQTITVQQQPQHPQHRTTHHIQQQHPQHHQLTPPPQHLKPEEQQHRQHHQVQQTPPQHQEVLTHEAIQQELQQAHAAAHAEQASDVQSQLQQQRQGTKAIGNYILGRTIGEGTFGKVKLGRHILSGEKVAIKVLQKDRIVEVADVQRVAREVHILKLIRHPHIVQLFEIIETRGQLYLIMEYASGGELFDHIVAKGRVPEDEACRFFHQIVAGVEKIHEMRVVHRDLKPENLLLDEHNSIKIVDFGLSNLFREGQRLSTACGSPCYAPPEMVAGQQYVPQMCDMWSCGVILFALVCGYLPFEDQNTSELYKKILAADYTAPNFITDSAKDLIAGLLTVDPVVRFTIAQVRAHPWYNQCPETSIKAPEPSEGGNSLDQDVLAELETYGFPRNVAVRCLELNKHNHITTTYYLLVERKRRLREQMEELNADADDGDFLGLTGSMQRPEIASDLAAQIATQLATQIGTHNGFEGAMATPRSGAVDLLEATSLTVTAGHLTPPRPLSHEGIATETPLPSAPVVPTPTPRSSSLQAQPVPSVPTPVRVHTASPVSQVRSITPGVTRPAAAASYSARAKAAMVSPEGINTMPSSTPRVVSASGYRAGSASGSATPGAAPRTAQGTYAAYSARLKSASAVHGETATAPAGSLRGAVAAVPHSVRASSPRAPVPVSSASNTVRSLTTRAAFTPRSTSPHTTATSAAVRATTPTTGGYRPHHVAAGASAHGHSVVTTASSSSSMRPAAAGPASCVMSARRRPAPAVPQPAASGPNAVRVGSTTPTPRTRGVVYVPRAAPRLA